MVLGVARRSYESQGSHRGNRDHFRRTRLAENQPTMQGQRVSLHVVHNPSRPLISRLSPRTELSYAPGKKGRKSHPLECPKPKHLIPKYSSRNTRL